MKFKIFLILCLSSVVCCSCMNKIDNRENNIQSSDGSKVTGTTELTTPLITTSLTETTTLLNSEPQQTELATDVKEHDINFDKISSELVVIGDSIALGYGAYQRLPMENVYAKLNVSVSGIHKYTFSDNGTERSMLDIVTIKKPKYIILSMGLNDINTYDSDSFSEKYKKVVDEILYISPDSKIFIMALSPVSNASSYTTNKSIDNYNTALKKAAGEYGNNVIYINGAAKLKDKNNGLQNKYSGGDGIHLSGAAYDVLLETIKEYLQTY